jgi:hypothetical protein
VIIHISAGLESDREHTRNTYVGRTCWVVPSPISASSTIQLPIRRVVAESIFLADIALSRYATRRELSPCAWLPDIICGDRSVRVIALGEGRGGIQSNNGESKNINN